MQRKQPTTRQKERTKPDAIGERADVALRALARILARQAAEKDFAAFLKVQEAANDND